MSRYGGFVEQDELSNLYKVLLALTKCMNLPLTVSRLQVCENVRECCLVSIEWWVVGEEEDLRKWKGMDIL